MGLQETLLALRCSFSVCGCVLMPCYLFALSRPRLWVEVVGARNLDSYQSVDAYCVIELLGDEAVDAPSNSTAATVLSRRGSGAISSRSPTASSSNQMNPAWNHSVEFSLPPTTHAPLSMTATPGAGDAKCGTSDVAAPSFRLRVQVFNEKNFFFDMFPTSGMSNSASSRSCSSSTSSSSSSSPAKSARRPGGNRRASWDFILDGEEEEDDDDVTSTIDKASEALKRSSRASSDQEEKRSQSGGNAPEAADEALGSIEIHGGGLMNGDRIATDRWYRLKNARSGEIRVRTIIYQLENSMKMNELDRDEIFMKNLYRAPMTDRHGFSIPEKSRKEWAHLRSYQECREARRIEEWTAAFGSKFSAQSLGLKKRALVRQLARDGIPNNWRQDVYMNISGWEFLELIAAKPKASDLVFAFPGAFEKKNQAEDGYYESLVRQSDSVDSVAFRQIELDIDRTFGHSGTQICTDTGRAMLRRVLRAYSIRNPSVGYCQVNKIIDEKEVAVLEINTNTDVLVQGLNFIVGFLTLAVDEEAAFWLLAVICEDLYPGYYTPTMADTQTDMLVLKELIAEELPVLDDYTADVGLPLELLGSQVRRIIYSLEIRNQVIELFCCMRAVAALSFHDNVPKRDCVPIFRLHLCGGRTLCVPSHCCASAPIGARTDSSG